MDCGFPGCARTDLRDARGRSTHRAVAHGDYSPKVDARARRIARALRRVKTPERGPRDVVYSERIWFTEAEWAVIGVAASLFCMSRAQYVETILADDLHLIATLPDFQGA